MWHGKRMPLLHWSRFSQHKDKGNRQIVTLWYEILKREVDGEEGGGATDLEALDTVADFSRMQILFQWPLTILQKKIS